MRAVNLLPPDLRDAAPKAARTRPEPVQGIGAYVVLASLVLCVAALAGYVMLTNGVEQRQADLVAAQLRAKAAATKATALKPYADFEARTSARVETVRGLAAARFDWEQALGDLSHAMPADVKLQTLNGDMGLPGTSGSTGADPLRGSIAAPAISLAGCASSHTNVARMMARIKAVDGVTRVSLSKSEAPAVQGGGAPSPCGEGDPPTFSIVAFFEGSTALEELTPATGAGASPVPVPNAVAGTPAPASTDPAAAGGPQPAAATPTPTSTTAGGTP